MLSYLDVVILGIVEGITEFLPISSTAHLILTSKVLGLESTEFLEFFEVFIQSGAILAVAFMYARYILQNRRLILLILTSFVPTAVIGLVAHDFIKQVLFNSTSTIALALVVVGALFIGIEYMISHDKLRLDHTLGSITYKQALVIGTVQSLAIVPGVSRAGIVMLGMMGMRYKRSEAALYSFLLAVPTITAASLLDLYKSRHLFATHSDLYGVLTVGFMVSAIVAALSIKWLIGYLQKHDLRMFGWYRIALGTITLVLINN
jgi:undecaprenyl-diphosphatase